MAETVVPGLGDRLRLARESAGLTQQELAHALDVDKSHVWRVEKGRAMLGAALLLTASRVTHVSVDWLLTGRGQGGDPGPAYAQFVDTHPDVPAADLEALRGLACALGGRVRSLAFYESVYALMRGWLEPGAFAGTVALNDRLDSEKPGSR